MLQINWLNRHTVILNGPKETISVSSTLIFKPLLSPSPSTSTSPDKPPGIVRRMVTPEMMQCFSALMTQGFSAPVISAVNAIPSSPEFLPYTSHNLIILMKEALGLVTDIRN